MSDVGILAKHGEELDVVALDGIDELGSRLFGARGGGDGALLLGPCGFVGEGGDGGDAGKGAGGEKLDERATGEFHGVPPW